MFFFRRKALSIPGSSTSSEAVKEILQRRANGFIATLQQHYPREFEKLLIEVRSGDLASARLTLRALSDIVDEGYIEPILQQLQAMDDTIDEA
jgi:hypothetical protein